MNIQKLKQIFPDFEDELYEELLLRGSIKKIQAGETLLREGQTIRSTLLLLEGIIKVSRKDKEGKEFFIYLLNPGQACSLSLVCAMVHQKSEVIAKALTNAVAIAIPLQYMDEWMRKYKSWYQFVIKSYHEHFEELLQTIDAIAFSKMDERIKSYLVNKKSHLGRKLKLTHQEIADDLNSSREVISRLLKKLEAKNFLVLHRNFIEILDTSNITVH